MPNRTIYLTTEQDPLFLRAQQVCRALGTSVGSVCAEALGKYADQHAQLLEHIAREKEKTQ